MSTPTVGILLAAGAGTRFGGGKLLAPLHGKPLVLHALAVLHAVVPNVLAVVRPGDEVLHELLRAAGARVLICPQAADGMGHSLACAARELPPGAPALVALGDMPTIAPDTVRCIHDAVDAGAVIAVPVYRGRRGHPVGFAGGLVPELATLNGDQGARTLLRRYAKQVQDIEVDDPGCIADIDTEADLAAAGN
ncbi:MAG: nucleotidyltransferase family protein [Pseudomonadota bacterium]